MNEWKLDAAAGVAGTFPGGVKWAVMRFDVGDEPVFMQMDNEAMARDWYASMRAAAEDHPDIPEEEYPKLVAARIHWQEQT